MTRLFIGLGLTLILAGVLYHFGALNWLGRLPGDITLKGDRAELHLPIATCIILSLALSLVMAAVRRFF